MKAYGKYTQTEIRWNKEMPSHWKCEKAKRFFLNPKVVNKNNEENNILSLTLNGVIRNSAANPIGLSPADYSTYQIFESNELVFKLIDLENISTSRVGIVWERGIMSSAYIRLKPRINLNLKYFYYQYFDWYKRNIFNGLGAGVRQTLSAGDLVNYPIVFPPRDEQDRIVRFLDWKVSRINKLIAIRREQISALKKYKERKVAEKLCGDKVWLKRLLIRPLQYGANSSGVPYDEKLPRYIRITDIDLKGCLKSEGAKSISEEEAVPYILEDGDVLLARSGATVGKAFLYKKEYGFGAYAGYLIRAKFDRRRLLPKYFMYFTDSSTYSNWKDSVFIQATIPNISAEKYGRLPIPVPNIEEQQHIINILDVICENLDALIETRHEEIRKLQELKAKIISNAVTGQIDVRDIEIPEYERVEEDLDEDADGDVEDIDVEEKLNLSEIPTGSNRGLSTSRTGASILQLRYDYFPRLSREITDRHEFLKKISRN